MWKILEELEGKWSITAKMIRPLTHDKGTRLSEAVYYKYKGNEQLIGIDESALIWNETKTAIDVVTTSDTWTSEENQPFMKVLDIIFIEVETCRKGMYRQEGKLRCNVGRVAR